jgi:branched-chain amino acid transport system permease protein
MHTTSPLAIIFAVLLAAAVGALVALPVLRLTGLYLALATLAFAFMMDKLVFQANFMFGFNGSLPAERVSILGFHFGSTKSYLILMALSFVLVAVALLALRRGTIGRLLIAMRDSPAACGTLGLNQRWFRVGLFATSAAIAGLGGALFAGLRETATPLDFQALSGLLLLLLAVACGVTSMTGALLGGFLLMLLPVLQSQFPALGGLEFLMIGVGAISLGRDPNGIANHLFAAGRWARGRLPVLNRSIAAAPAHQPNPTSEMLPIDSERVAGHGVA